MENKLNYFIFNDLAMILDAGFFVFVRFEHFAINACGIIYQNKTSYPLQEAIGT